jgi:tRNA-specific 2-thiouridylase
MQIPTKKSKIIVGMSGGVDSSVAAVRLKKMGHEVIGLFMKNWDEKDERGNCKASLEYEDVIKVCERFDIPYYSVEFVEEYYNNVFQEFLDEYKRGWTPNPDILCNREIKFKVFFKKAMELGADYLATGHYCQIERDDQGSCLLRGEDAGKDQTYFLYTIKDQILDKVLFPIGDLQKSEVRALAEEYGLHNRNKKDSTGICFIGERNFKEFLGQFIDFHPGEFQTLTGEKVGEHSGAMFYTLGQRKGLGLGGPGEPWYVVDKDPSLNIVYVERGHKHPHLERKTLWATDIEWVRDMSSEDFPLRCTAKIRYRQQDQSCQVYKDGDRLRVEFDEPQRAMTLRQSIVFYQDKRCLGGAIINELGDSLYQDDNQDLQIQGMRKVEV